MTRRRREEELDRDIREHLEMEIQDNLERGMTPEAARAAALRKFGNVARIKEDTRAVWGWTRVEQVLQDIRYALRMLRKNPGFAIVTIVTLALGIGMNTAVFSVVNAVLLKPLPYPNAERLVWLSDYNESFKMEAVAGPDFLDWKQQAQSFEKMAAYSNGPSTISINGNADQAMAASVTGDFWGITGARPSPGRAFAPGERGVVVLGRGIFERRLGSDPGIIGKTVTLDGRAVTVVGVMPPGFRFQFPQTSPSVTEKTEIELYQPSDLSPANQVRGRNMAVVNVVAKLKAGISIQRARAEMEAIQARIFRENPQSYYNQLTLRVLPLQEKLVGSARRALLVLLAAVGFVLLIACANIANLLLARASSRQKEIAVRTALGAGRLRVVRQFLAEGLVLSLVGGAVGLLLAQWGIVLMLRLGPQAVPRLAETAMDGRALAFTFAVSLATGLLFGLGPALACSQTRLHPVLKEGARTSASSAGLNIRRLLVGGELALALVLLIGAGLMLKSFWRMNARPAGFQPESILLMRVTLSGPNYRAIPQQLAYIDQELQRLEAAPGVQAAGIGMSLFQRCRSGGRRATVPAGPGTADHLPHPVGGILPGDGNAPAEGALDHRRGIHRRGAGQRNVRANCVWRRRSNREKHPPSAPAARSGSGDRRCGGRPQDHQTRCRPGAGSLYSLPPIPLRAHARCGGEDCRQSVGDGAGAAGTGLHDRSDAAGLSGSDPGAGARRLHLAAPLQPVSAGSVCRSSRSCWGRWGSTA